MSQFFINKCAMLQSCLLLIDAFGERGSFCNARAKLGVKLLSYQILFSPTSGGYGVKEEFELDSMNLMKGGVKEKT